MIRHKSDVTLFIADDMKTHYVKSVQIRSFFWSVYSCIRTEYGDLLNTGKYGPEKTPYLDTFHAVTFREITTKEDAHQLQSDMKLLQLESKK